MFKLKLISVIIISWLSLTQHAYSQDSNFHIYLSFGQSNMAGSVDAEKQDSIVSPRFKMMSTMDCPDQGRSLGNWYEAIPPLAGCKSGLSPADYFGRKMVQKLPDSIKVGIINVSVPGCKIELFQQETFQEYAKTAPDWMVGWIENYGGNPYDRLVAMAKKAQEDGVIKGFLLHQGESNTGDKTWPTKVKTVYNQLIRDLNLNPEEVPLLAGEVVGEDENGICASMNTIIATLPDVLPNSYVIPSDGCESQSDIIHFTASGYRKLGKRYANKMLKLLGYSDSTVTHTFQSPNENIEIKVATREGKPVYEVSLNGKLFVEPSPLGLNTNVGDFRYNLTLVDTFQISTIKDVYSLPNIKKSNVEYNATEAILTFLKDDLPAFDLVFRVSNNDIAYRYHLYPQNQRKSCVVKEEATGFVFPEGTTTFLTPQSRPMVGFARTMPSYEMPYEVDAPMGKNGIGFGYTFPCLFKISDQGWVLLSETGVDSQYCGSRLLGKENGLYTIGFPMPDENNGNGTSSPGVTTPGETPWRTITLGESLAPIVETTVSFDVVKPLYAASQKYNYTKGTWSWVIGMDESITFEDQKKYVDLSAAMGYQTILVDNYWDTKIGKEKIVELAKYGASKGVGLYLWYNSNGYWNDAPQGPRNIMDRSVTRRKEMAWLKEIGIKGIKVDFFGGDKQMVMKLYEDILYDANDYGLQCIFHGCTLPRGWERMFPNYASSEAVLASENLHFAQSHCEEEAFKASIHPFIRNAVGSMDFGGTVLNDYWNTTNSDAMWGGHRITSDVFQLATAVLFQSGVQHFALAPNNINDAPKWAIDFMKEVPTIWDETQLIDGYPGKYVILARRHGNTWYIAGVNAQEQIINKDIALPMLKKGIKAKVYTDNNKLEGKVVEETIKKPQNTRIEIPKNGGFLIIAEE
ncbi:glycoside hydrolase family 97 catalytic domain-containing protein [Aegicerativicinus sediminis]|uniref:glycoside hydrolase family 97 catalytic domain-containing protein n=1 Tax=Aegicerativicinus sediminis TaxID=2893202 RepID=UPI001E4ACA67|nr:glycoside hydrolase family 97 catalytic domain-containing protein [Aegicerativicinus sediminis]